jgi:beta-galactosidase
MHLGVDYYPEQWVFPYGGTAENPEAAWEHDADLMVKAGFNTVRIGEYSWGLCEREEGKYDFAWLKRVMDIMAKREIQVVLGTPTAAPPIWLAKKHPEMLPVDEHGRIRHEGTRRAACFNSDAFWNAANNIRKSSPGRSTAVSAATRRHGPSTKIPALSGKTGSS